MGLKKMINNFWFDERGQSTTEYILILSVVVMIAMKFKQTFGLKLGELIGKVTTDMEKAADNPQ